MILVTGASGNVGNAVLRDLLQAGAPVRAMYRSTEEAAKAPAGANPVIADFADRASLDRALSGVEKVFLVCAPIPQLVELESNMVDACREHGVRHVAPEPSSQTVLFTRRAAMRQSRLWTCATLQRLRPRFSPATATSEGSTP